MTQNHFLYFLDARTFPSPPYPRRSKSRQLSPKISAPSPTLERLRRNTTSWRKDGLLGQAAFQITIAPTSEVFDIAYYEYHRVSALLTGSRVVIAYPPLSANLSLLLEQYTNLSNAQTGDIFSTTYASFSHSIAIVQKAGETLTLPPFWSFVTFYISTSVAAEYCVATATKYMQLLEHTDLSLATTRMRPDNSKWQAELIKYVTSLATHLDMILNDKAIRFDTATAIKKLCWTWDSDIKSTIAALIGTIDDEDEQLHLRNMFSDAWIPSIDRKRKKKIECRLCHVRLERLGESAEDMRWLELHVVIVHGLGSEVAVARGADCWGGLSRRKVISPRWVGAEKLEMWGARAEGRTLYDVFGGDRCLGIDYLAPCT